MLMKNLRHDTNPHAAGADSVQNNNNNKNHNNNNNNSSLYSTSSFGTTYRSFLHEALGGT